MYSNFAVTSSSERTGMRIIAMKLRIGKKIM
jgi:hypothetical protein